MRWVGVDLLIVRMPRNLLETGRTWGTRGVAPIDRCQLNCWKDNSRETNYHVRGKYNVNEASCKEGNVVVGRCLRILDQYLDQSRTLARWNAEMYTGPVAEPSHVLRVRPPPAWLSGGDAWGWCRQVGEGATVRLLTCRYERITGHHANLYHHLWLSHSQQRDGSVSVCLPKMRAKLVPFGGADKIHDDALLRTAFPREQQDYIALQHLRLPGQDRQQTGRRHVPRGAKSIADRIGATGKPVCVRGCTWEVCPLKCNRE